MHDAIMLRKLYIIISFKVCMGCKIGEAIWHLPSVAEWLAVSKSNNLQCVAEKTRKLVMIDVGCSVRPTRNITESVQEKINTSSSARQGTLSNTAQSIKSRYPYTPHFKWKASAVN